MKDALIGAAAAMAIFAALLAAFYNEDPANPQRKTLNEGVSPEEALRRTKGRATRYEFGLVVVPAVAAVGLNIAAIVVPHYNGGMHAVEKEALIPPAAAMCAFAALLAAFYNKDSAKRQRRTLNKGVSPEEALRRAKGRARWYKFGLVVVPALAAVGLNIAAILVPRL
jgi:hypothetical protein